MAKPDDDLPTLPREPVDRLVQPITRFLHVEAAGGVVLLVCTVVALALANSPWSDGFLAIWKIETGIRVGSFEMMHSLKHWINDGLMAIFFFVVGLEVKREIVTGELRDPRGAALPVAAAVGGMVVPAAIYLVLEGGGPGARGWGIPMATDIAFVVGLMSVLGPRVPRTLRVLLLSLAIVDDIGAILVIAIGYTESIDSTALLLAFGAVAVTLLMQRIGVRSIPVYVAVGVIGWLGFHESGVHATIAGVIFGLLTPARSYVRPDVFRGFLEHCSNIFERGEWGSVASRAAHVGLFQRATRETISPLEYLENALHPWSSFVIMPLFALANAGVRMELSAFADPVAVAVMAGLVVGKMLGILLSSWLVVSFVLHRLPEGLGWGAIAGAAGLAGIGFTMALFIAGLALEGPLLDAAKVGVLGGSLVAAVLGTSLLLIFLPKPEAGETSKASH